MNNNIFTIVIDEIKLNEKSRNDISELIDNENDILFSVFFDNLKNENIILVKEKEIYKCNITQKEINENIIKIEIYNEKEKCIEYNNSLLNIKNSIITFLLSKTEYIKVKFLINDNFNTILKNYLQISENPNIEYEKIVINIYKLTIKETNNLEYYNVCIKYNDENFIFTNKEFNIDSKNIEISSEVILNIPKININNIYIILYKNDKQIETKEINWNNIQNKLYENIQYIKLGDNNLLLNIEDIILNETEKFPYCKIFPLSKEKLTFAKEKGKNNIWNINLIFNNIYTLPKNITNSSNLKINFEINFNGNIYTFENDNFFFKKNFEFQSVNDNIFEIPNMEITLKYKDYIFKGIIEINQNSTYTILSNINKKIPLIIIIQLNLEIIKKKFNISLIPNLVKENNSIEESLDSFDSNSKYKNTTDYISNESDKMLNSKAYFGILTLYNFKGNKNNFNCISISLNSFTHFLFNLKENISENKFLFYNIRFDESNPKTYPLLIFTFINSENDFENKSYKLDKLNLRGKNWFFINNKDEILLSIDFIEENNLSEIQNEIDTSNNIPKEYIFDCIFIGYRDYNNCQNHKLLIDKPNILINLNSINEDKNNYIKEYKSIIKEKGSNSNFLLSIYENITLKLNNKNNNEIYLNCYNYDNNNYFGISKINIKEIVNKSEIILNERINLIKEICGEEEEDEINTNKDIKLKINKTKSIKTDNFIIFPELKDYSIPGTHENEQYFQSYKIEDLNTIPNLSEYKVLFEDNIKYKHYRKFYDSVLENKNALNLHSPFININVSPIHHLYLKILIQLVEKEQYEELKNMLVSINNTSNISYIKELAFLNFFDDIKKNILIKKDVIIKIFITEINLLIDNISDFYFKIFIGGELKYNSDNDNLNENIEIKKSFPSNSLLRFELWEKNKYENDKLIGYNIDENLIDLENRFYNYKWINIQYKPIEKIILVNDNISKKEIGNIFLWIEINEKENKKEKEEDEEEKKLENEEEKIHKIDLKNIPNPIQLKLKKNENDNNFQIRCIVYDIEYTDAINNVNKIKNDLFVISKVKNSNPQYSDIHYNCDGYGYFNWRFIFNISYSSINENNIINFSICDNSINNIELCSGNFNYTQILYISNNLNIPLIYSKKFNDEINVENKNDMLFENDKNFWINLYNTNVVKGRIKINFEIIPFDIAKNWEIGKGRNNPNINPYLPYPIGRIKWVSSPFKLIKNIIPNDRIRNKICSLIICSFILFYLIFLIPYIIYHLSGEASNPFNYLKK